MLIQTLSFANDIAEIAEIEKELGDALTKPIMVLENTM